MLRGTRSTDDAVMDIARIKDPLKLMRRLTRDDAAGPDERDLEIERLERAFAEEREHAAGLRKTIDELDFKAQTLERSYSTQLEEARRRIETLEGALAEHKARLAELDGTGTDAATLLEATRAELARVTAERDRLRRALGAGRTEPPAAGADTPAADAPAAEAEELSIDELLEDALWAREQERIDRQRGVADTPGTNDDDTDAEMIPPDLVLAGPGSDED